MERILIVIVGVSLTTCAIGQDVSQVEAGLRSHISLECPVKVPKNYNQERLWILPNGGEVRPANNGGKDAARVKMEANNNSLSIGNVTLGDNGLYICHIHVANSAGKLLFGMVRLTVSDGTVTVQPWDAARDYKSNIIRGLIAAFSTAIAFTLCCLVYKFRWKSPEKRAQRKKFGPAHNLHASSPSEAAILPSEASGSDEAYDNPTLTASSREELSRL